MFIYLVFHLVSFVLRPWFLYKFQDESFLRNWVGLWLQPDDHERALWIAGIGLIMFVLGGLAAERIACGKPEPTRFRSLDRRVILGTGAVFLLIGLVAFAYYSYNPRDPYEVGQNRFRVVDTSQGYTSVSTSTSYITSFYNTSTGVFVVWIAFLGFRRWMIPLVGAFMLAVLYQGYARTRYVTGLFAIIQTVMGRRGRKWPSWQAGVLLFVAIISFTSGKWWARDLVEQGAEQAFSTAFEATSANFTGEGAAFINYDSLALTTYLVPDYAPHSNFLFYGRLVWGWVPRAIFPEKPIFDFPSGYLSTHVQDVTVRGLTVTLIGESYMAFGIASVVLLMTFYGAFFGYAVARSFAYPAASVERIFGVAMSVCMVQIARDGIQSIVLYMMLYFGPCAVMWAVCIVLGLPTTVALAETPTAGEKSGTPARLAAGAAVH